MYESIVFADTSLYFTQIKWRCKCDNVFLFVFGVSPSPYKQRVFHLLGSNLRLETHSALVLKSREFAVQNQMQASGSFFIPQRRSSSQKKMI